jgi:dTDP-4-dehydrorhamnose 3,5-epimerase
MRFTETPIAGVVIADSPRRTDQRGSFSRWFCEESLLPFLGGRRVRQSNHSCTTTVGAIRGLHFQHPPHCEMKLVRCIRGAVWDVAVDLRAGSPTFLQWHAERLSAADGRMMVIPEGCAHGFQVLEPASELLYLHTADYEPSSEGGVRWNDPRVSIHWPQPVHDLSERDRRHPLLDASFKGLKP